MSPDLMGYSKLCAALWATFCCSVQGIRGCGGKGRRCIVHVFCQATSTLDSTNMIVR